MFALRHALPWHSARRAFAHVQFLVQADFGQMTLPPSMNRISEHRFGLRNLALLLTVLGILSWLASSVYTPELTTVASLSPAPPNSVEVRGLGMPRFFPLPVSGSHSLADAFVALPPPPAGVNRVYVYRLGTRHDFDYFHGRPIPSTASFTLRPGDQIIFATGWSFP
jgi:hypothetical protein